MEFKALFIKRSIAGNTLPEMLVAVTIGCLVLTALASLYMYSARSFADLANYMDMDSQSRIAVDYMGRDIRQASRLSTYATNKLTFLSGTNSLSFTYDNTNKTLVRSSATNSTVLLRNCDYMRFDIFGRNASNGNYDFYPAADATSCKIVQVTWACSRSLYGRKTDTEHFQAAKIVIRKQK